MTPRVPAPKGPDWPPEQTLRLLKEQLDKLQEFKGKTFTEVNAAEDEWGQFTQSVIIHGFGEDSQNLRHFYTARNAGVHNLRGISTHQMQLNFQARTEQYQSTLNSSIRELDAILRASKSSPEPVTPVQGRRRPIASDSDQPLVLISHSSKDAELASALVQLLRAGLLISRIRCSSVDGFRLPAGVHTETQLRAEVNSTNVLIGLITPNSLASAYVMFELGARWGAGNFMIPLLAGVTTDEIRGPLSGINALRADNDSQLHQLLGDIARILDMHVENPATYTPQLSAVKTRASEVKLQTGKVSAMTAPEVSPQELRRRQLVSEKMRELDEVGRNILRHVDDLGQVDANSLRMDSHFNEMAIDNFIARALPGGLISYQNDIMSIKPELKSALEFVFSAEYDEDLKV